MARLSDLIIWQRARELVKECYLVTSTFPRDELYGITSQQRRAAVSVAANIAEGYGRRHRREFLNFLSIAGGSLSEVETYLHLAVDLEFVDAERVRNALGYADEIGRMATALRRDRL